MGRGLSIGSGHGALLKAVEGRKTIFFFATPATGKFNFSFLPPLELSLKQRVLDEHRHLAFAETMRHEEFVTDARLTLVSAGACYSKGKGRGSDEHIAVFEFVPVHEAAAGIPRPTLDDFLQFVGEPWRTIRLMMMSDGTFIFMHEGGLPLELHERFEKLSLSVRPRTALTT